MYVYLIRVVSIRVILQKSQALFSCITYAKALEGRFVTTFRNKMCQHFIPLVHLYIKTTDLILILHVTVLCFQFEVVFVG